MNRLGITRMTAGDIEAAIKEALAAPYTRLLYPNEHGGFSCEVLEFPGCYATGDDVAEAMEHVEEAIGIWIEASLDQGQDIPPPLASAKYSGRVTLRVPPALHQRAVTRAAAEGVSLNRLLSAAVASYTGEIPSPSVRRVAEPLEQYENDATRSTT